MPLPTALVPEQSVLQSIQGCETSQGRRKSTAKGSSQFTAVKQPPEIRSGAMRKLKQEILTDRRLFSLEKLIFWSQHLTPLPGAYLLLNTSCFCWPVRAQTVSKNRTVRKAALGHLINQYFMEQFIEAGLSGLPPLKSKRQPVPERHIREAREIGFISAGG